MPPVRVATRLVGTPMVLFLPGFVRGTARDSSSPFRAGPLAPRTPAPFAQEAPLRRPITSPGTVDSERLPRRLAAIVYADVAGSEDVRAVLTFTVPQETEPRFESAALTGGEPRIHFRARTRAGRRARASRRARFSSSTTELRSFIFSGKTRAYTPPGPSGRRRVTDLSISPPPVRLLAKGRSRFTPGTP